MPTDQTTATINFYYYTGQHATTADAIMDTTVLHIILPIHTHRALLETLTPEQRAILCRPENCGHLVTVTAS